MTTEHSTTSISEQSNLLVNRALCEADSDWFRRTDTNDGPTPLPPELVAIARQQWRGRQYLAQMLKTQRPFQRPIDAEPILAIGIRGAAMINWLSRPIKALEPQLLIIGASVMAPAIREQIQRQAVLFWRNLLGDETYAQILSRRRGLNAAELCRQSTSALLNATSKFNVAGHAGSATASPAKVESAAITYPMLERNLVYLGLQELWCFLQQYMPVVADRARLLIPPRYFDPNYVVQLKTGEMVAVLSAWIAEESIEQGHREELPS